MDYRDEVFMTVAEHLNFSKAAEALFISQPAVTKHIKELERKNNVALFERKGNKVYLTKAGKLTYRYLKSIKQQYRELEYELGQLNKAFEGTLFIGASSTISQYVLPSVIAAFYRKFPSIKLELYNGNSLEMERKLLANEIDIALVENIESNPDIRYVSFLEDELVAVTQGESVYAKKKLLSIDDLSAIPLVLREKGSGTLQVIQKLLHDKGVDINQLNTVFHLGSTEAIKNFLNDFDGLSLISERAIEKELLLKRIVKLNIKDFYISRDFRIAFRRGPELRIPTLFADFISRYNF
ncbi:LysR family transcriptional regulator [Sediminitomix flava]|uniref:DNA-binding transcriptional LysR family regulator n=1 Tax=Sediminitomix flava TaxID=379075 RepID=A0A315Z8C5_SEDFL|nr:LysR family transcriptional regulator [Sediminitomix flava]PWJ40175.1 DNA-binding transcriptional LysR family regulator [Sediminitomix flava]